MVKVNISDLDKYSGEDIKIVKASKVQLCCPHCSQPLAEYGESYSDFRNLNGDKYIWHDGDTLFCDKEKLPPSTTDATMFAGICSQCNGEYIGINSNILIDPIDDIEFFVVWDEDDFFKHYRKSSLYQIFLEYQPVGYFHFYSDLTFDSRLAAEEAAYNGGTVQRDVMQCLLGTFSADNTLFGEYGVCGCGGKGHDIWRSASLFTETILPKCKQHIANKASEQNE